MVAAKNPKKNPALYFNAADEAKNWKTSKWKGTLVQNKLRRRIQNFRQISMMELFANIVNGF